jgi:primary-amine oxidase
MNRLVAVTLFLLLALSAYAHPLEPLSADEHQTAYDLVRQFFVGATSLPDDALLFPFIALREPPKSVVRNWSGGADFPREATVQVMHVPSNRTWIAIVDLRQGRLSQLNLTPAGTQGAVTTEEYVIADELVHAYEPWQDAMRARGVDPDEVYVDVWAPGDLELPGSVVADLPHRSHTRLLRALAFLRGASVDDYDAANPQNPYVRPIEGVVVTLDMNQRRVVHMTNTLVRPVSRESGNAPVRRTGLKPMRVSQPNGGSFEVTGRLVRWQKWQFYAVLHPREGLVLYDVRYDNRPIGYRLSLSEIYVPYGVADRNWSWRTAFDVGEYNLGTYAQPLEPLRDVPEHAYFFDAVFGTDTGETYESDDTIGLYERDHGLLWTRTDPTNYERDTRGRRDLVVTWNAWIGNYIYGFDWIFGMDGTLEVKVALTGTTLNRGAGVEEEEGAPLVAIDEETGARVSAPNHQHFFSFRLDLDIDGVQNVATESEVRHLATPLFKNAFGADETVLTREGFRDAEPLRARHWEISSATAENALGKHTSYAIETNDVAVPYSDPDYEPLLRAAFANHPFWVTRFRDDERYAAGEFPNQGAAGAGLQSFVTPAESLGGAAGADLVVWQTIGLTHVPRPEDYPVMPTESIGFELVPHGFFDRNPALDAQELPQARPRVRAVRR